MFVSAVLPSFAPAASEPASGLVATLVVHDDSGAPDTVLQLEDWISFNPASGRLQLAQPGTNLGTSGWVWHRDPIDDPETSVDESRLVMRWTDESRATISLFDIAGDVDPYMSYSFATKNNTNFTQTYTFVFGEAILPAITGPYSVYSDVGISLTNDPSITSDATIAPVIPALKFQRLLLSDGVTSYNAGVDVGDAYTRTGIGGTSIFGDASPILNDTTLLSLTYWEFQTEFTLTANGDAVAISGFAQIIPEPSTYALVAGSCVLILSVWRRRRVGPRPSAAAV